jgi:O-antigen ligase
MAILVGTLVLLGLAFWGLRRSISVAAKLSLALMVFGAVSLVLWQGGILHRFAEMSDVIRQGSWDQLDSRIVFWKIHFERFLDSPYIGYGIAHLSGYLREAFYDAAGMLDFQRKYNAHNIYLETLVEVGVVGFCLLLSVVVAGLVIFYRLCKEDPLLKVLYLGNVVALVANGIHGLTQNVFFDASVMVIHLNLFWLMNWTMLVHLALKLPKHEVDKK